MLEVCPELFEMEGDVAEAKWRMFLKTLRRKLKKRQLPVLWKQSLSNNGAFSLSKE